MAVRPIINPSFEDGTATGWTIPAGVSYTVTTAERTPYGQYTLRFTTGTPGLFNVVSTESYPVYAGKKITASCNYSQGPASTNRNAGRVVLEWLDENEVKISESVGTLIFSTGANGWNQGPGMVLSSVTATAPEGTKFVKIGVQVNKDNNSWCAVDNFVWDYEDLEPASITSPTSAGIYRERSDIYLRTSYTIPSGMTITAMKYIVTNTLTADVLEFEPSLLTSPWAVNTSAIPAGSWKIQANITLNSGEVVLSDEVNFAVGDPPPPITREYRASNSAVTLVMEDFSSIVEAIPSTALVIGAEIVIGYSIDVLSRNKDKDVSAESSTPDAVFSIVNGGKVNAYLLDKSSDGYTQAASPISSDITIDRSDFTLAEEATSEEYKWSVFSSNVKFTSIVGSEDSLFGLRSLSVQEFLNKSIGLNFHALAGRIPNTSESGNACVRFKIDTVRLRVYFDAGSVEYYFASPDKSHVVKGTLVASNIFKGSLRNGDGEGTMQLAPNLESMPKSGKKLEGFMQAGMAWQQGGSGKAFKLTENFEIDPSFVFPYEGAERNNTEYFSKVRDIYIFTGQYEDTATGRELVNYVSTDSDGNLLYAIPLEVNDPSIPSENRWSISWYAVVAGRLWVGMGNYSNTQWKYVIYDVLDDGNISEHSVHYNNDIPFLKSSDHRSRYVQGDHVLIVNQSAWRERPTESYKLFLDGTYETHTYSEKYGAPVWPLKGAEESYIVAIGDNDWNVNLYNSDDYTLNRYIDLSAVQTSNNNGTLFLDKERDWLYFNWLDISPAPTPNGQWMIGRMKFSSGKIDTDFTFLHTANGIPGFPAYTFSDETTGTLYVFQTGNVWKVRPEGGYYTSPVYSLDNTDYYLSSQFTPLYSDNQEEENEVRSGVAILNGYTVHTHFPPTDENKIADVNATMTYNGLPIYADLYFARTKSKFITANFYGDERMNSMFGVNGVGRAYSYTGEYFYKIYTQPEADLDRPRHVAYHHGHLALGYKEGRVDISVAGEPWNFSGVDGASSWGIGDSVTGMIPLSGTILGIFCDNSITGLSGTTVDNFATQVISPRMGALEYTVVDMGFPVYANSYGIYTLSQTQEYGDYLGTPLSQDISPWLRPRLTIDDNKPASVNLAYPVRSKNQYRLSFTDGYILTMTMNFGQQGAPTFSKHKYTL